MPPSLRLYDNEKRLRMVKDVVGNNIYPQNVQRAKRLVAYPDLFSYRGDGITLKS